MGLLHTQETSLSGGVSLGLTYKGDPILGVLYFPLLNLLVSAKKGEGAYANGVKLQNSSRPLKKSLYYAGGLWQGKMYTHEGLLHNVGMVQILSASAYELAQIALGNAEIYLLANNAIDVVAGICIVKEAGGVVTEARGDPWALDSKTILVATNTTHQEIIEILSKDPYGV
jgi:myo-inositol-1(or 4)-monophosphatase